MNEQQKVACSRGKHYVASGSFAWFVFYNLFLSSVKMRMRTCMLPIKTILHYYSIKTLIFLHSDSFVKYTFS